MMKSKSKLFQRKAVCKVQQVVYSTFIEVKVELLRNRGILLMNRDSNLAHIAFCAIVDAAIIKYELHVLHEFIDALVLVLLKLRFDRREVHRVLHHRRVVQDVQRLIVDRVRKDVRLLVTLEHCEHSLRGLLPLVKDWSAFRHFRHLELINGLRILTFLVEFEVLG